MKKSIKIQIQFRLAELHTIIEKATMYNENAPEGILHVIKHGKGVQYYLRKNEAEKNGIYIRKSNRKLAKKLAQKEYYKKVSEQAKIEEKVLKEALLHFPKQSPEEIYLYMNERKRNLVTPIEVTDEEFIEQWKSTAYETKGFFDGENVYYSEKDERMRSKSEVLIANLLNKLNIPYKYEKPLFLSGLGNVYPDFTILDVAHRREIYLEHMGLLDNSDYREKALNKINKYEKNGIFVGDRLLLTHEYNRQPLDIKTLEQKLIFFLEL